MGEAITALGIGTGGAVGTGGLTAAVQPENSTPFQQILDNALGALENVSKIEDRANTYIQEYAQGNVSMEDVLIEATKMQMAMELAITMVNQTVSTFKEIQQMQV